MAPQKKKKPLWTPDGRPEMRSPDQMLRDAAESITNDLPTKSRTLDLDSYFRSGETDRVANRLLKDNGVLPQHLQDRKDAEALRVQAEETLETAKEKLYDLRETISEEVARLHGYLEAENLDLLPKLPDLNPNPLTMSHREAKAVVLRLQEGIRRLDGTRKDTLRTYEEMLGAANTATDRYNKHVAATGRLMPVYPSEVPTNIEARLEAAAIDLPEQVEWDEENVDALLDAIQAAISPINKLKRLIARGTRPRLRSSNLLLGL